MTLKNTIAPFEYKLSRYRLSLKFPTPKPITDLIKAPNPNFWGVRISNKTPISETFYTYGSRNKYNYIRMHSRRLIDSLGIDKVCSCCKFEHGVQICHIKSISDFPEDTPLNEVNSIDNLILLCPNCHWLFDHGYPSLDELKQFYKHSRQDSNLRPEG